MTHQYKYKRPVKKKIRKKMSFEKKVLLQTAVSAALFAYCMLISYSNSAVGQKEFINRAVNITSTKRDIRQLAASCKNIAGAGITYAEKSLDALVDFCNNGFGNQDDKADAVMAQSDSSEKEPEATEINKGTTANTPENTAENTKSTEAAEKPAFRWPAEGDVTSAFGERIHPLNQSESIHYGIDIAGNYGDCVISSLPGTVEKTGYDPSLGNYVKIRHSAGLETVYGHLSAIHVSEGETVDSNTRIGSIGSTGAATGPHVHLEVRVNGESVDPMTYLPAK